MQCGPSVQTNSSGTTWANGATSGTSLPISKFFVAQPSDSAATINSALASGQNLIFTPGVYNLSQSINVTNPDTVVLGLGFPTLIPQNGVVSMQVANAPGVMISGLIFDAGTPTSPALLQVGESAMHNNQYASDPPTIQDVFFFFNQGVNIYAANAFEVPATLPAGSLHDLLTSFLSTGGSGGILNVINNMGGSSTIANPDTPVTVTNYP